MADLWKVIREKYNVNNNSLSDEEICLHEEVTIESGNRLCNDCGTILAHHFQFDQHNFVSQMRRKRVLCSIYSEIPAYIDSDVKNLTVELYKLTTDKKIFRNIFRRAIILACLHRASILLDKSIFFDEMLEIFNLKIHEANKGISFVSNNIPKNSGVGRQQNDR